MALIVVFVVALSQQHVFYFEFMKKSRFQRFCANYKSHFLVSLLVGIIFMPFAGFAGLCASVQLFLASDVIFDITCVVASEPVSFTSNDNKRLIEGLRSKGIFQYLAFADLYAISGGTALRRKFLFKDPTGKVFTEIVDSCSKLMRSYADRHASMHQLRGSSVPLHMLNNTQWRRNQINRPTDVSYEIEPEESGFFSKLTEYFLQGSKNREKRSIQLMKEALALEYSTLVIFAAQSLVRMMFILPKEDQYGVGQISAEKILDILLTVKSVLDQTAKHTFISPNYGNNWFAKNPTDLTRKTKETIDWGVNQIFRHFQNEIDYSRLSFKNIEYAERLLGRKKV